jgi:hypothetical protein
MSEFSAPPASISASAPSPADIEARQDDLLRQLDALEKRIARVLSDYAASVQSPARQVASPGLSGVAQPAVGTETPVVIVPISATTVATAPVAA